MRYFLVSNDEQRREEWVTELRDHGFDVVEEYGTDAIIVTLGGDGTILHAARTYEEPTILPVRTQSSLGYKTQLDLKQLLETLDRIEAADGDMFDIVEHRKLAAYRNNTELHNGFSALNEISVHHASPILASVLAVAVRDGDETYTFDRIIGDGVLVATPFGSTGYYRSVTGGTISEGLGVAFNNVHTPADTPNYLLLSADGVVEVEMLESEHASSAVLTRDNYEEMYELSVGEPIEIQATDETVEILQPRTER